MVIQLGINCIASILFLNDQFNFKNILFSFIKGWGNNLFPIGTTRVLAKIII